MKKDFFILGTGPIGVISALYLLENGFKVVIIDNSSSEVTVSEKPLDISFKNTSSFSISEYFITIYRDKFTLPASAKSSGGFSNVWGGTINIFDEKDFNSLNYKNSDLYEKYLYILKKLKLDIEIDISKDMKLSTKNNIYDEVVLNIEKELNKRLKNNKLGYFNSLIFLKDKKIWSSNQLLEELKIKYPNKIEHISNFEVVEILEEQNEIILKSNQNKDLKIINAKLLVAAGALSTSVLISKFINTNSFTIKDSQLQAFPLFWLGKNSKTKSINTYPQIFFDIKNEDYTIRTQLYSLNSNLIDSIASNQKILKKFLKIISKLFTNRIFINFVYSHSNNSTFCSFEINQDKILVKKIIKKRNNDLFKVFRVFASSFFQTKLLPIPFSKKFRTYGSFHIGGSFEIGKLLNSKYKIPNTGQVKNNSNIHIIDSTTLKTIPSGPITFTAMANALKIIDEIIE
jgi:hypothetical protein